MKYFNDDPHKDQPVLHAGEDFDKAKAAMVLIHGRGADAKSILSLSKEFNIKGFSFIAPQAAGNTWYPFSFLSPIEKNEPGISSGLKKIKHVLTSINKKGINDDKIILLGFSQGACLTLEYAARNPKKYGGIIGLSGGLIGPEEIERDYSGSFKQTPIFLGCSNIDPHIPEERVHYTADILKSLNAEVTKKIYPNMGHTINEDEINSILSIMNSLL